MAPNFIGACRWIAKFIITEYFFPVSRQANHICMIIIHLYYMKSQEFYNYLLSFFNSFFKNSILPLKDCIILFFLFIIPLNPKTFNNLISTSFISFDNLHIFLDTILSFPIVLICPRSIVPHKSLAMPFSSVKGYLSTIGTWISGIVSMLEEIIATVNTGERKL